MSAIESSHFVVQLAPSTGNQLCAAVTPRQHLPLDRWHFCQTLERELRSEAELIDGPYHSQGVKNPWGIFRFAAGTPAWKILRLMLKRSERVYRTLVPVGVQCANRKMAKAVKRRERRRRRYAWRKPHSRWGNAFS